MGTNTTIAWTDHTFNCWRGCTKVSAGCDNCYAETQSKRNPAVLGVWGDDGVRVPAAEAYWQLPHKWNRQAEREAKRHRVFSLSLGDWLEDRAELIPLRARLLSTISQTPNLDWQLLTKRPEGWRHRLYEVFSHSTDPIAALLASRWLDGNPPANVWLGVSLEDQATADARIPLLLQTPAAVRFVSAEPLLGLPSLDGYLADFELGRGTPWGNLHWVIVGGESGPGARPMHPAWPRALRDQCQQAGVSFFFKQWGEYIEWDGSQSPSPSYRFTTPDATPMVRVGKHNAGRLLDGRTWDEFPKGA